MKTYCFRFWGCKVARREGSSWSSLHRTGLRWAWQGDNDEVDEVLGCDEGDGEDDEVEILGTDDKTTAAVRDFKVRQTSGIIQWFWQNSRLQGQTQPGQRKLQLIHKINGFSLAPLYLELAQLSSTDSSNLIIVVHKSTFSRPGIGQL